MLAVFCPIVICCFILDYIRMDCGFIYYILNTSVFNLSNVLITLNLCQYLVSLRFVYQMYRGLNEILKGRLNQVGSMTLDTYEDTANDIYISGFSWFHREFYSSCCGGGNKFKILKSLSRPYFDLDRIMAKLTKVFGIILLFNFLGSLLSLAVECFAVYKFFDNANILGDTLLDVHNRFLWLLIHVGRILLILIANHAIIEEKCRTIFIINELHITSKEMERAINRFLLRLMVHQPVEMACGAVDLDLLVLSGIAGAMANYIIFLIQTDVGRLTMERSQNITIAL
ncbi:putative gustatory receptor 59e [Anastrepha obliqua]|uniref:putative gustatory receptor 59e n=1 Tax=Anastrepha obliqua TaxID=95512 RepID=UPI00240A9815|nr:putative gustatory receptor 59e [Anastrepha obliqua]